MSRLRAASSRLRGALVFNPGRPAWGAGLRAAIATFVPILAGQLLGVGGGTWMSLAGFTGALADKGGPYRTRAMSVGTLTIAGAVTAMLGALVSEHFALSVPLAFAIALVCSLARVWGNAGASVGLSVLNIFVISLAVPSMGLEDALARAGFTIAGGAWAMFLSLGLWPLRPFRPVRLAVAECWRAVAAYAEDVYARVEGSTPVGAEHDAATAAAAGAVRAALESARTTLAVLRRGRPGESGRGERLLVLREAADQLFGHLVALAGMEEGIPRDEHRRAADDTVGRMISRIASAARAVADAVEREEPAPRVAIDWSGAAVRQAVAPMPGEGRAHYEQIALVLDRLAQYATLGAATAATLDREAPPPEEADDEVLPALELEAPVPPPPPLRRLLAILAPGSLILRHALRVAVVVAVAVALVHLLELRHGYWVTITAVIILQPWAGTTNTKALQRVLGTVLGGMLAAALSGLLHDPTAILALTFLSAGVCVALLPINYAAYAVFLTPTFVLLAEASEGDWHLAGLRIENTLLGGALALLGSRLLWPSPEWKRLPTYLAEALRADGEYLRLTMARFADRTEHAGRELRAARRHVGLAAGNAEESFERLLVEHRGPPDELAPAMTILTYARRLSASIAALALSRHSVTLPEPRPLETIAGEMERILGDLALAVQDGRPPAPLPPVGVIDAAEAPLPPLLRGRIDRIARQLRTVHDAVARWVAYAAHEHAGATGAAGGARASLPTERADVPPG